MTHVCDRRTAADLGSPANLRLLRVKGLDEDQGYMVLLNGVPLRPHAATFAAGELAAGVAGSPAASAMDDVLGRTE